MGSLVERTICPFCNVDFKVIGRHTWRCKARVTSSAVSPMFTQPTVNGATADIHADDVVHRQSSVPLLINETEESKCVCGRHCKGRRDLKAHQRSCARFKTVLNKDFSAANMDNKIPTDRPTSEAIDQTEASSVPNEPPTLDIKLLRTSVDSTCAHQRTTPLLSRGSYT